MRKNELEKLERFLPENPNNYATLLGYYGYWYLTDKGSFEYPAVESAGDSESADSRTETDTQKYRMHTYEVYWEPGYNNFIIISYPSLEHNKPYGIRDTDTLFDVFFLLKEEAYHYLAWVLRSNQSTIVYCYETHGSSGNYDIYYDAWDIEQRGDMNKPYYSRLKDYYKHGFFSREYLLSRMKADDLQECGYKNRDIRKEKAYPSAFQWEEMKSDEYKALVTDKGIEELVRQCDAEQLKRKSLDDAVELFTSGKGISPEQLAAIYARYPFVEGILTIVEEFRALLKKKNPDALLVWIDRASALHFPEIDAFVNGIKYDIDAVLNAIATNFSNGLAEGTINKIKVIKRIMYGRCQFNLLKNKCLLLDEYS